MWTTFVVAIVDLDNVISLACVPDFGGLLEICHKYDLTNAEGAFALTIEDEPKAIVNFFLIGGFDVSHIDSIVRQIGEEIRTQIKEGKAIFHKPEMAAGKRRKKNYRNN